MTAGEPAVVQSTMSNVCPCSICGERDHPPWKCSTLRDPLREGFYNGGGGGRGGGGGGDDDERLRRGGGEKLEIAARDLIAAAAASITTIDAYCYYEQQRVHYLQRGDHGNHGKDRVGVRA
jgi:hypothetical protein